MPQDSSALLNDLKSEVAVEAAPLLQLIVKYAGLIVLVLVMLIAALAGTAGYQWYKANAKEKAQAELQKVLQSATGEQRIGALEKFLPNAPDTVRTPALLALADAASRAGKFDKAAEAYGQVQEQDVDGAVGLMAGLNQSQLLMHAGKAADAVKVLEKLENTSSDSQRILVRQLLAEAALLAGDTTRAKQALVALQESTNGADKAYYTYRLNMLDAAPQNATPAQKSGDTPTGAQ